MKQAGVHAAGSGIFYFGLSSTKVIATTGTAGDPTASYSGAIIYRLSGDTGFRTQSSNGSAKTTHNALNYPSADGTWKLRIDIADWDALNCQVTYKVNNTQLKDSNGLIIADVLPYASLAKMGLLWLVESDANASAQTGQLDYIGGGRFRSLLNG